MARPKTPKEKPITAERPASIVLTHMQAAFVDAALEGKDNVAAARAAGYAGADRNGDHVAKSTAVQLALREARDELSSAAQIKRADVLDGFMEAINMARLAADPQAMIKGWTEVGKMLGYYAPEVKKLEITANQKRLQQKYEALSDEDLLKVIEGEAVEVLDDE